MSSKNETPVLIAALLLTVGLLGAGYWWFSRNSSFDLSALLNLGNSSSPTAPTTGNNTAAGKTFSDVQGVPSGLFSYGGSTTWAPIRGIVDPALQQAQPAFQLRYIDPISAPPGSGTGIAMLLANQLAFAQSSRPVKADERQQAESQGYSLKEIPVALEGIAIAVHPNLPVTGITLAQLRDIYLGQITNWNQIGGPDLGIVPVSRPTEGGTVEFFIDTVLGGTALPGNTTIVNNTTEALRFVSDTPGSIYYASAPEVVGQCTVKPIAVGRQPDQLVASYMEPYIPSEACPAQRNQINLAALQNGDYPLTRRLFVIVREDGQLDQQAGETYANLLLTQEGQELLQQAGFVAIR